MPKYTITSATWLHLQHGPQLLQPLTRSRNDKTGKEDLIETIIEWDGWPNAAMEPMDDEGRELVMALEEMRARGRTVPASPALWREQKAKRAQSGDLDEVEIPEDWMGMKPETVVNLGRKLGASSTCKLAEAAAAITREVVRREQRPRRTAAA